MMDESIDAPGQSKEYLWTAKLDKTSRSEKWDGIENCESEQLILKMACLGAGATSERNVVELVSFGYNEEKLKSAVCSLSLNSNHSQNLCDICLDPPVKFNLVEGNGPVHIIGNHVVAQDIDEDYDDSDYEDEEDMEANETADSIDEVGAKIREVDSDEDDEDEEDEEDNDEDGSDEEEEEDNGPAEKKRKTNGKAPPQQKKDKKKPNNNAATPKTPTNGKPAIDSPNKSAKKSPKAPPESIEEVKSAIKKVTGGKPRKQEKFNNWVKNTFKLKDEAWLGDLWKWHQKECGL